MTGQIQWQGQAVPFAPGETVGSALLRAGVVVLGGAATGQLRAVFCGIGQCQGCLVQVNGVPREACLTPCCDGLVVMPGTGVRNG